MADRRVLVTGAAGFVGRHALPALVERGYAVHAVSRHARADADGVRWHAIDLLDPDAVAALIADVTPSHLLHLAWVTQHGAYWHSPANRDWFDASLALVRAFAATGGQRAVIAGSCAEYDWTALDAAPIREDAPTRPATPYGQAKLELYRRAADVGISLAWGRLFFLYGPNEPAERLVPSVIRAVLAGRRAACTPGIQVRDFLHSSDAGRAFAALLDSAVESAVNIASGVPLSVADLATRIGGLAGRPELIALGALPARPDDPPYLVADVTRLRTEVGYAPAVDLDSGLAELLAWSRAHA
jgi:nucleoside-diphosphate-sugar epimerase